MAPADEGRPSTARRTVDPPSVRSEHGDGVTRVVLAGEIDAECEKQLTHVGDEALSRGLPIEVDCSAVTFMDSTGVAFLAMLASRADPAVTLLDPPDIVRFLVEMTGIGPMLRIEPTAPQA